MFHIRTLLFIAAASVSAVAAPLHALEEARTIEPGSENPFSHIQAFLDTAVEEDRIPSGIAMIAQGGDIIWRGASGDMGPGIAMRSDSIMPLASLGKIYTATAAMILYERDQIGLDDPVSQYIPAFADVQIAVPGDDGTERLQAPDRPITIYHLLTHTSGLHVAGDAYWPVWNEHAGVTTTTEFARALAQVPMNHQPGARFEYGYTGGAYEVLAAVIEIASGQTLEAFMVENMFEPLNLEESHFFIPEEQIDRYPAFFRRVDETLQLDRAYGESEPRTSYFFGGGGVAASPQDIARFTRMFTEASFDDENRIISANSARLMMQDHLGELATFGNGLSWGFGGAVRYAEGRERSGLPDQYGWVGGGYAKLIIAPAAGMAAYIAFPINPPGDNDLLDEFDQVLARSLAALRTSSE